MAISISERTPEALHSKYDRLIARAKEVPPVATVAAYPCDQSSLKGVAEAAEAGIIVPILVGPSAKIASVARTHGVDISKFQIEDTPDYESVAATRSVELIRAGKAEILMKGSLHTDALMLSLIHISEPTRPY